MLLALGGGGQSGVDVAREEFNGEASEEQEESKETAQALVHPVLASPGYLLSLRPLRTHVLSSIRSATPVTQL